MQFIAGERTEMSRSLAGKCLGNVTRGICCSFESVSFPVYWSRDLPSARLIERLDTVCKPSIGRNVHVLIDGPGGVCLGGWFGRGGGVECSILIGRKVLIHFC